MAICRKPYITPIGELCPCQQCPECLDNRKQIWTNRNILESYNHKKQCFLTLTYDDENIPFERADKIEYICRETGKTKKKWVHTPTNFPTLNKYDAEKFIKRLRKNYGQKIRYYLVGEYGTAGERGINPHYHALLYGIDEADTAIIENSWKKGFIHVGNTNIMSIQYVVGYVEKKTKYNKDMYEEMEITPEYSTMSLKPSIGCHEDTIQKFAQLFKQHPEYLTEYGDVPYSVYHGDRTLPFGNFLREQIRIVCDLPHDTQTFMDEETGEITEKRIWHGKEEHKAQRLKEMQILQENKKIHDPKMPKDAQVSIKHYHQYKFEQSQKQFDVRQKLKQTNHTL